MADLSLKNYLQLQYVDPHYGVRSYCAPFISKGTISLRSLMTSPRIIHISDLHFTDKDHTWDLDSGGYRDSQHSDARSATLLSFLVGQQALHGSHIVIITGDLTDSGGDADYGKAGPFISLLRTVGKFDVYAVPGNHDYCWEGVLALRDTLMKGPALP